MDDSKKNDEKRLKIKRSTFRKSEKRSFNHDNKNSCQEIDDFKPVIRSSITNELSFSKELKHLLKRNINRDFILNNELNMVKGKFDEFFEPFGDSRRPFENF